MDNQTNKSYTQRVYFNPNFKTESASHSNKDSMNQNRHLCHINPDFKRRIVIASSYNAEDHTKYIPNGKIHLNPKMLANVKHSVDNYASCVNNVTNTTAATSNKFCKINPPMEEKKTVESNDILIVPRAKKPCHSLIRSNLVKSTNSTVPNSLVIRKEPLISKSVSKIHTKEKSIKNYKVVNKPYMKKLNKTKKLNINKPSSVNSIVIIGGEKYLNTNTKLLKISKTFKRNSSTKVTRCISIKGKKFIRKSDNVFELDKSAKVSKKINAMCPIYRRSGSCVRHVNGKCPLLHDPKCVAICKKFLQGDCQIDGCNLSHSVIVEKMPTCKYFLEGCCSRVDCPYLHVKINENADVCAQFVQGYCAKGKNCSDLHIEVCPSFYKTKTCERTKCPHPHKTFTIKKLDSSCDKVRVASSKIMESSETGSRYFVDNFPVEDLPEADAAENKIVVAFKDRPSVGSLPSFISL